MATVQRYVNTASSGGDGTTNGTSGSTAAYASLSAWEAAEGAVATATDDHIVDCCGTAADTTAVTIDFATTPASILIRGNRSDSAGFYDGTAIISTSHYRLTHGAGTSGITIVEPNVTIDGIQIESSGGVFRGAIRTIPPSTAGSHCRVRKCRLRAAAATDFGIGSDGVYGATCTYTFENNLIVGFTLSGINAQTITHGNSIFNIYHNTIWGDTSSDGIQLVQADGLGTPVYNVKGNALANSGSQADIDAAAMLENGATVTYADNATEQFDLGTTNEIDLGATTDAWTNPGTDQSDEFTVKNTSSALYNAVNPTLVTTDITDFTRDGTNHDVGCFEFQATSILLFVARDMENIADMKDMRG